LTSKKQNLLKIPQGTETFYFEEAHKHNQINQMVSSLFTHWGYLPIHTPLFDFYDIYHPLLNQENRDSIYRLMDRDGELLMLRSDITLFLAKQISLVMKDQPLPSRISYSGPILRHEHEENISRNEFYQTGIELIGVKGLKGDLEVLHLLNSILDTLQLPKAYFHLGSRALFQALFPNARESEKELLVNLIKTRKWDDMTWFINENKIETSLKIETCIQFISFLGTIDEFLQFFSLQNNLNPSVSESLIEIKNISMALKDLGMEQKIRIDFSETGKQPYYTGFVFQVYCDGADDAVVSGGRYDKLLPKFGLEASAVGFSIMMRKIEPLLENSSRFNPEQPEVLSWDNEDIVQSLLKAEEMRKQGKSIILE